MRRIYCFIVFIVFGAACAAPGEISREDKAVRLQSTQFDVALEVKGEMPSLKGATGWLNSRPLSSADLRGKVVLIDFWTYTCINWLRTQPHVRAWSEKYKDKGLVIIGVHTPEFEFEKDIENVRRAAKELSVDYPIAVDSDYSIWNAFNNRYWPAFYFVDAQGRIRHHQFGEGDYDRSERVLQKLLVEAGGKDINTDLVTVDAKGVEAQADWNNLRSPENYLGFARTANFASPEGFRRNESATYSFPAKLTLNQWSLAGEWKVTESAARSETANGRIRIRFHARDLHLVMGPTNGSVAVRFRVLIDGQPPGSSHGIDTNEQGFGTISAPRMYQLIRQIGSVRERDFEIEFLDSGVELSAFTFG